MMGRVLFVRRLEFGVERREEGREVDEAEIYCCGHTSGKRGERKRDHNNPQHRDFILQLSVYPYIIIVVIPPFAAFVRVFVALHPPEVAKREC
jgi:hypothetical protein